MVLYFLLALTVFLAAGNNATAQQNESNQGLPDAIEAFTAESEATSSEADLAASGAEGEKEKPGVLKSTDRPQPELICTGRHLSRPMG